MVLMHLAMSLHHDYSYKIYKLGLPTTQVNIDVTIYIEFKQTEKFKQNPVRLILAFNAWSFSLDP